MTLQLDPATAYHGDALIDAFLQDDVPVLIREGGRYPAVLVGDASTRDVPHVDIAVYCTRAYTAEGAAYVKSAELVVTAVGRVVSNRWGTRRRALHVISQTCESIDAGAEIGRRHIEAARALLAKVDSYYDSAEVRIGQGEYYRGRALSRDEYEGACRALNVQALSDADVDTYGVRYGDFDFPTYQPDYIVTMHLAGARLSAIDAAKQPPAPLADDGGFYRPDASATDRRCARCGDAHAAWIAGAGEALCVRHQDDY